MRTWPQALRAALISGSAARILSTAALAICGKLERDNSVAPTNASSHWI